MISWSRLAGLAIAVGGLIELAALQAGQASSFTALIDSKPGVAALLKIIGGLAVWVGFHERATAGVGVTSFALVLASFWFDGHTVSEGPWLFHSLVNFVHVGAAAVLGGGVFAMTGIVWSRRRRNERAGLARPRTSSAGR